MPFIIEGNVGIQACFAHSIIKFIEFARLVDFSFCRANHQRDISTGTELGNKIAGCIHIGFIITHGSSSCFGSFDEGNRTTDVFFSLCGSVVKWLQSVHHPVVSILSQSTHDIAAGVHMSIDKSRQQNMMAHIKLFFRFILVRELVNVYDVDDLASVYDKCFLFFIADTFAFHGVNVRCGYNQIYFFHVSCPP